jgi:hypothetical protein
MSNEQCAVYAVPTHLHEREPFAFGRTVGEVAKLVAIVFLAAEILGSTEIPAVARPVAAGLFFAAGATWALVRIQRRPLEEWLGLLFQYRATPRRRVWRADAGSLEANHCEFSDQSTGAWYELQRIRVRWRPTDATGLPNAASISEPLHGSGVTT